MNYITRYIYTYIYKKSRTDYYHVELLYLHIKIIFWLLDKMQFFSQMAFYPRYFVAQFKMCYTAYMYASVYVLYTLLKSQTLLCYDDILYFSQQQ